MAIELVLGLGNPGDRYAPTRHNVGFRVVEEVLRRRGTTVWLDRPLCGMAVVSAGRLVVLARPKTFMNRSGEAARWLLSEIGVAPEQMLVVVDDVDLPLGSLRLRRSGGPGTHNGLRDMSRAVGDGFPRLRVGVRGRGEMSGELADYVLSAFPADEIEMAAATISRAADAVDAALRNSFECAMNVYNRPQPS